uniref:Organic cation/carnitine transporter 7-like n=1 Tax=Tanacetum cinerariifolium TaxID=118510 RepID=A0A6L2K8Y2_TANCI|nr:hypothetical protein [Tanacetum cinerariifolium]
MERFGWRLLLGVSLLPSLFALLFYKKVPKDPRFLYAKGELAEASIIFEGGAELNKRPLPGGGLIYAHTDESTHNVQALINTISAPPMIGEGAQNKRKVVTSEEDDIKYVTLDMDKTVAGEIQIDEEYHTLKNDDPVDRAGPKVEQGNLKNEKEDETNKNTKLITRHNNTHKFLDITSMGESVRQLGKTIAHVLISVWLRLAALRENLITSMVESVPQLAQLFSPAWWRTTALLLILVFLNTYSYYEIIHLTSKLKSGNIIDTGFYKDVFIISLAELPGLFLAYWTMETLGRKRSMAIILSLGYIGFFIQVMDQQTITKTTVFVTHMLMSGSFAVMQIYSEEIYPTQLRTLGVGVAIVVGRVGSVVLPWVGEGMISDDGNKMPTMVMFAFKISMCMTSNALYNAIMEAGGKDRPPMLALDKVVIVTGGSSETTTKRIDNDIYSTVDACPNACEMWKAIERLKLGESINVKDLETNLYWEFRKFTSRDGESLESYYSRFYKMMNELVRNQCDVINH